MESFIKITIVVIVAKRCGATIDGLSYMDPLDMRPLPQDPPGYNPCNPPYWYPREIPAYCYLRTSTPMDETSPPTTAKPIMSTPQIYPYPPMPQPIPIYPPIAVPISPPIAMPLPFLPGPNLPVYVPAYPGNSTPLCGPFPYPYPCPPPKTTTEDPCQSTTTPKLPMPVPPPLPLPFMPQPVPFLGPFVPPGPFAPPNSFMPPGNYPIMPPPPLFPPGPIPVNQNSAPSTNHNEKGLSMQGVMPPPPPMLGPPPPVLKLVPSPDGNSLHFGTRVLPFHDPYSDIYNLKKYEQYMKKYKKLYEKYNYKRN